MQVYIFFSVCFVLSRVVLCCAVSCHVMSALRCVVLSHVVLFRIVSCHVGVTVCCAVLCCVVSCRIVSCHVMSALRCVVDNVLQDKNSWTRHLWHSAWYRTLSASPSQLKLLMPTTHLLFSISQVRLSNPLMFLVTMTGYRRQLDSP